MLTILWPEKARCASENQNEIGQRKQFEQEREKQNVFRREMSKISSWQDNTKRRSWIITT